MKEVMHTCGSLLTEERNMGEISKEGSFGIGNVPFHHSWKYKCPEMEVKGVFKKFIYFT